MSRHWLPDRLRKKPPVPGRPDDTMTRKPGDLPLVTAKPKGRGSWRGGMPQR